MSKLLKYYTVFLILVNSLFAHECLILNPEDYGEKQIKINNEGVLLTILYNKNNYKSTNNNCVLYGYGAYGLDDEPYFNKYIPSLLDRGYIYCIAHIRGGGKYGEKCLVSKGLVQVRARIRTALVRGVLLFSQNASSSR